MTRATTSSAWVATLLLALHQQYHPMQALAFSSRIAITPMVTPSVRIAESFSALSPLTVSCPASFSLSAIKDDDVDDFGLDKDAADAPDYLVAVGELEGPSATDDGDVGSQDDGKPPAWAVLQTRLAEVRAQHRRHETDVGSPEYQVAGITERINYLTSHLQVHPKDFSTRRGLVALVNKRRRLLNYLSRENETKYKELIASLGIRHRAPGEVPSRAEQYSRFPNQKAVKKHLVKNKKK